MSFVNQAIINTLCYAKIFHYPLKSSELYYYLISEKKVPKNLFIKSLSSLLKNKTIEKHGHFYCLKNDKELINLRLSRQKASQEKISLAHKLILPLKKIPTIQGIFLTGSLAMNNSDEKDDIDIMIVTEKNRLWLTRLIVMFLLTINNSRRFPKTDHAPNKLCPNIFIDTSALLIHPKNHNLYIAHEVAQAKSLFDRSNIYAQFLNANSWINKFLPHIPITPKTSFRVTSYELRVTKIFEKLAYYFQVFYMSNKRTTETTTPHSAFFHPHSPAKNILKKYNGLIPNS